MSKVTNEIQLLVLDLWERSDQEGTLKEALEACTESGYQFRMLAGEFKTAAALSQAAFMVGFFSGLARPAQRRGNA